jgi:hypothetical protein
MLTSLKSCDHLYIGADDSNHAGTNKKGEIIAVTFSIFREDSVVKEQVNRRDPRRAYNLLNSEGRDYAFTILTDERSKHCGYNLVLAVPLLVEEYLKGKGTGLSLTLNLYFDGPLRGYQRRFVCESFPRHTAHADGFCKKELSVHSQKRATSLRCPDIVIAADAIAHDLYTNHTLENLLTDPHMIAVSHEEMAARNFRLRSDWLQQSF